MAVRPEMAAKAEPELPAQVALQISVAPAEALAVQMEVPEEPAVMLLAARSRMRQQGFSQSNRVPVPGGDRNSSGQQTLSLSTKPAPEALEAVAPPDRPNPAQAAATMVIQA